MQIVIKYKLQIMYLHYIITVIIYSIIITSSVILGFSSTFLITLNDKGTFGCVLRIFDLLVTEGESFLRKAVDSTAFGFS